MKHCGLGGLEASVFHCKRLVSQQDFGALKKHWQRDMKATPSQHCGMVWMFQLEGWRAWRCFRGIMGHEYRRCLSATSKHAYGPLQCSKLVKWPEYWGSVPLSSFCFLCLPKYLVVLFWKWWSCSGKPFLHLAKGDSEGCLRGVSKWLKTMVRKFPKDRVVGPLPKWPCMAYYYT